MKLIIDIPDYTYEAVKEYVNEGLFDYDGINATLHKSIANGTPLDKIRAEIKGMYRVILKGTPKDDWAVRWNDCLDDVLEIIDKYKAESEDKE